MTMLSRAARAQLAELARSAQVRASTGLSLVSGAKLVADLAAHYAAPVEVLVEGSILDEIGSSRGDRNAVSCARDVLNKSGEARIVRVKNQDLALITGLKEPDGVAAVFRTPEHIQLQDALRTRRILVLDDVSDPGNCGTLLRSALAFGWDAALLLGGADPHSMKVTRAAQGANFLLPLLRLPHADDSTIDKLHSELCAAALAGAVSAPAPTPGCTLFAVADAHGADAVGVASVARVANARVILALGNEARGCSESLRRYASALPPLQPAGGAVAPPITSRSVVHGGIVAVRMARGEVVDSLNVAVAGSILMHALQ